MPEGLDQAANAFQTEIAPGSNRPRDDSGRFASVSRPEPMFEPRPMEGDPATGDTRDAGDDPRLAEMERRIADGRSEQGDEARLQRLSDDAARARATRGDGRRSEAKTPEQAGRDDQSEQQDQDNDRRAQGEDAEGRDAEGLSERDAESETGFRVTTKDGTPVEKFEVTVDGQAHEVSLDEALKGYIREQTFHQRMNKVAEARQGLETEAQQVLQTREMTLQRLQQADRFLAELTPAEPDWDKEFAANPQSAHERWKAYAQIYGKRQAIANDVARIQQEQAVDVDRRTRDYALRGFSQFVQDANIPDEKTLQSTLADMRSYGKSRGFNEGELATVFDPRMLAVLRDATLYRQSVSNRPKPVTPGGGKTLRPGAATPIGNAGRRSIDDAQSRLAKTGRLEDAAALMQRLIR